MPQEELKRGAHFAKESAPQTPSSEASSSRDDTDDMGSSDYSTVGRSAGLMTILTIVSRVTGFIRTWAMAAAIGMSLLSSSYQVANNLPNMLYELVMGGMLVTAFLPVYMGVRRAGSRGLERVRGQPARHSAFSAGWHFVAGDRVRPGLYLDAIVPFG